VHGAPPSTLCLGTTMDIACLIPEDITYRWAHKLLASNGLSPQRFDSDVSLIRALCHRNVDAVLIHCLRESEFERSILSWLDNRDHQPFERRPIIIQLGDNNAERVKRVLDAGADDVIVRSAGPTELVARVKAVIRRHRSVGRVQRTMSMGGFELRHSNHELFDMGKQIDLTSREFTLAWLLFSRAGTCVSRRTISTTVWGVETDISDRTLEQHVHRLRKKLQLGSSRGVSIRAVYGHGYQLDVGTDAGPETQPGSLPDMEEGHQSLLESV